MKLLISANGFCDDKMKTVVEQAHKYFDEVVLNPWGRRGTQEEIKTLWEGADAIICGAEVFDSSMISQAPPALKVISHFGVGVDNIDIRSCKERGILVCNTPGANAESVADMALCLILACARQVVNHDKHTRTGEWKRFKSIELKNKQLGIIGFGAVGKGVAQRAAGFGMSVCIYDPYLNDAPVQQLKITICTLEDLLSTSDIVSLNLPCNLESFHIINTQRLSMMKEDAILINTARGDLVDEAAVYEALKNGKLGAYGTDVYSEEPAHNNPLFTLENTTVMPHCAANTTEASVAMGMMAVENAYRALNHLENAHIL